MSTEFNGCVVVVTGSSKGIGLASAKRFAEMGARVVMTARTRERAETAAKQAGGQARGFPLSLESSSSCAAFVKAVIGEFRHIDVLINNAGVFPRGTVAETKEADWQQALDVNLTGVFRLIQLTLPYLARPGGRIVNLVSGLAVTGGYASGAYAASKAGLMALTRTLGIELVGEGIRANALSPGVVDTELLNNAYSETERRMVLSGMPGQKAGKPEDILGTIVYLASKNSYPMTGQTIFLRTPVALGAPRTQ